MSQQACRRMTKIICELASPQWKIFTVCIDLYLISTSQVTVGRKPTQELRYDTIGEFNVDWKAEYSALSSTRSQKKKKLKQPTPVPL